MHEGKAAPARSCNIILLQRHVLTLPPGHGHKASQAELSGLASQPFTCCFRARFFDENFPLARLGSGMLRNCMNVVLPLDCTSGPVYHSTLASASPDVKPRKAARS